MVKRHIVEATASRDRSQLGGNMSKARGCLPEGRSKKKGQEAGDTGRRRLQAAGYAD